MEDHLIGLLYLANRFLHIVATALLLGGTVFYELVVPVAIGDLKEEQKLLVFARARWVFRWVVWCSAIMLLLSGIVSTVRNWPVYQGAEAAIVTPVQGHSPPHGELHIEGVGYWWLAHACFAAASLCVALALVRGPTPPRRPLFWMRINILVLLLVILLASATRHVRLQILDHLINPPQSID